MFCLRVSKELVTWLTFIKWPIGEVRFTVWLGSGISQLKSLQYDWAREFPDFQKNSVTNLPIDLPISNSCMVASRILILESFLRKKIQQLNNYMKEKRIGKRPVRFIWTKRTHLKMLKAFRTIILCCLIKKQVQVHRQTQKSCVKFMGEGYI